MEMDEFVDPDSSIQTQATCRPICLHIDGEIFKASKLLLCSKSDYFRAMFSGNYVENDQNDITIDIVDAKSMGIILIYMIEDKIDLADYSFPDMKNLVMATNFLQITELQKLIEQYLERTLSISNWVETMSLAESASYTKLQRAAETLGLVSFNNMKPEYIPNIEKLIWYLSNRSLNTECEFDVFKFGYQWIPEGCLCSEVLLIILGCLDVTRLTLQDIKEIEILMTNCDKSLATNVVACMKLILKCKFHLTLRVLVENRFKLYLSFTPTVYFEVFNIVHASKPRFWLYTPVVPIWSQKDGKLELAPHFLYKFEDGGLKKWLHVGDQNLWGWSVTAWGPNKLVQVCGELGRGTGRFMKSVKVYNTLRNEWTDHEVELPIRRHAGVTVAGDLLFIIGGVAGFRVLQDTAFVYDLNRKTHRKIADFPDAIQSPAICTHQGTVYAAGFKNIYKYEDLDSVDRWITMVETEIRPNHMASYKEHIYCSQNFFSKVHRFRPGIDKTLELLTTLKAPPSAYCNDGYRLLIFTKPLWGEFIGLMAEDYRTPCRCPAESCEPKLVWMDQNLDITINDVAGTCSLIMDVPTTDNEVSRYHQHYLTRYAELTNGKYTPSQGSRKKGKCVII